MTHLILLRHGEVEGIDPPVFRGRLDLPLTPRGVRQAELTRDALSARHVVNAIYCSPLSRCVRTADIVSSALRLNAVPHPGLTDLDYGAWTGLADVEVAKRWPQEADLWKTAPHALRIPGGESLQDLAARVIDALALLLHAHPRGIITFVSHDSAIRVLLCHALGLPLSGYRQLAPTPCGISVLACTSGRCTLESFNETQHLLNA